MLSKRSCLIAVCVAAALFVFTTLPASAATYNWTKLTGGPYNWDDATSNWTSGFPNAIDDIANLNKAFTSSQTINLNRAITIGRLNLGSSAGISYKTTIAPGTAGSLVMDVSTGNAIISQTSTANRQEDIITANILLNDNLTLSSAQTDARGWLTISGIISGTDKTVEKTGAGLVRLVGAQNYGGLTTITAGTLQLGSGVAGGNGTVPGNIVNNATLSINNADPQSLSSSIYSGSGAFKKTGAGTLTLNGSWTPYSLYADGGTTSVGSSASLSVGSGSSSLLYVGTAYDGTSNTGTLDVSSAGSFIANVGSLYVGSANVGGTGNGTLKLGNCNITATTSIVIGGGEPENNAGAGNRGVVTVASGTTVNISTPRMVIGTTKGDGGANTFTLLGSGATLNLGTSSSRTSLYIGKHMDVGYVTGKTVSGDMNLSAGTGNLYLNQLILGINRLGTASGGHNLTGSLEFGSGILDISGTAIPVKIGYTDSTSTDGGSATGTLTIANSASGSVIEATDNSTAILLGTKGSTSSATGTLNLKGGTLTIKTTGSAIAGGGGGTSKLYLGETSNVKLIAGANSADWINGLGTAEIKTGGLTLDTVDKTVGMSQAFSGAGGLTKDGSGTLTLSGANTYTGATTVNAGTLRFAKQVSLYNNTTAKWTPANIKVAANATLALNVGGTGLGEFTSSDVAAIAALGTETGGFLSGSTLALDTTNAGVGGFEHAAALANPNSGSNALGLTKLGAGTLTLSNANTYTGPTAVNAGTLTLALSGSISNSSSISIAGGATYDVSANSGYTLAQPLRARGTGTANVTGALNAGSYNIDM